MFSLDAAQQKKLATWLDYQHERLVAIQEQDPQFAPFITEVDGKKRAYLGATGGGLTYEFTPTGMGTVVVVTFCKGMKEHQAAIDLTDYGSW